MNERVHLIYCDKKAKVLDKLLEGSKTMIIRGAAGRKLPHSQVFPGEMAYFIINDGTGLIRAKGKIKTAFSSGKMTEEESKDFVAANSEKLNLTLAQLQRLVGKKYLVLVEVKEVETITPFQTEHQKNMDDWLILKRIEDVLVGTGKPHEYIKIK